MYIGSGCSITGSTYQGLCPTDLSLTLYLRISGIAGLLYTCLVGGIWYCKHRGRESEKHKPLFYFIMPLVLIIMYFIGKFVSIYIIGYALRLEAVAITGSITGKYVEGTQTELYVIHYFETFKILMYFHLMDSSF